MAYLENLSGRALGEFILGERIDEGGFGEVYRCEQPLLGRQAVIKVLHQRLRSDDVALRRFMREALLASRLDHPYAAHVYAFGIEPDGLFWIAMELVHGTPLDRWLRERGPLPLDQFVPFFDRVAEVVHAAHERGIVHRDIKPSNVMVIERAGRLLPKLLDFGVAKLIDDEALSNASILPASHESSSDEVLAPSPDAKDTVSLRMPRVEQSPPVQNRLTGVDTAIGSPPYMSPEQWADPMAVGPASDLYALGVVAFEALTGRRPFTADSSDAYDRLHRHAPVPLLGGQFSNALDRVFQRALAKHAEDRYVSALELAAALHGELTAHMREQIRSSARQWDDRARPDGLLWRGAALADLERWKRREPAGALTELECSFVEASRRGARRSLWLRRALAGLVVMIVFGAFQFRAALQTRMAQEVAELSITHAEVEQGRQALLHDESAEAQIHLSQAYQRGDRSPGVTFMLSRALQPRLAEQGRFVSTSGRMWSALFSPDGSRLVTTDDTCAQVWDAQTNRLLYTLSHGDTVYQAMYSADGAILVTAGASGIVRIWNTDGKLVRELPRQGAAPRRYFAVALSPDGKLVAASEMNGSAAHVWNASTGAPLAELRNEPADLPVLAFSPDGKWLATTGGDDVRVFDTTTWTRTGTLSHRHVRSMSFDPTGPRLVTGAADGDSSIWTIPSGTRLRHLRELGEPVDAVAFDPSGGLVVTASRDGAEQVWDARSGGLRSQFNPRHKKISSVEFDRASTLVVAAGSDGAVVVSDVAQGMTVAVLEGSPSVVKVAHFDPSSRRVVSASADGIARVWDATSPYRQWNAPPSSDDCGLVTSLEPDRRFVAVGCRDQVTRVWDTLRGQLLAELPAVTPVDGDFASAFPAVSAEGDRAAIARGNAVVIYELPGGQPVRTVMHTAKINAVAFAAAGHELVSGAIDGSLLVTQDGGEPAALSMGSQGIDAAAILSDGRVVAAAGKRLRVYDADRHAVLAELELPARVRTLRVSPDGRRLVTVAGYLDRTAPTLWDLLLYRRIGQLEDTVAPTFGARFTSDGAEIITAGGDGVARRWDAQTGRLRQVYRGGSRFLADATLTPDGALAVAGDGDGLLRFWDATSGRALWTMQAHKSHLVGIHFENNDIVTRGFAGDISRWSLPKPAIQCSRAGEVATANGEACVIVAR